jgi:hypothetical protein
MADAGLRWIVTQADAAVAARSAGYSPSFEALFLELVTKGLLAAGMLACGSASADVLMENRSGFVVDRAEPRLHAWSLAVEQRIGNARRAPADRRGVKAPVLA